MEIRKIVRVCEDTRVEAGRLVEPTARKVCAAAVLTNPFAGEYGQDLSVLVESGAELGQLLTREALSVLGSVGGGEVSAYGKGAIVGTLGALEHAAAVLHPRFGRGVRSLIGPGNAIMSSAKKIGGAGSPLLIPLANKEDIWRSDDFDAIELCVSDSPRPNEILIAVAFSSGGRPGHRITMD